MFRSFLLSSFVVIVVPHVSVMAQDLLKEAVAKDAVFAALRKSGVRLDQCKLHEVLTEDCIRDFPRFTQLGDIVCEWNRCMAVQRPMASLDTYCVGWDPAMFWGEGDNFHHHRNGVHLDLEAGVLQDRAFLLSFTRFLPQEKLADEGYLKKLHKDPKENFTISAAVVYNVPGQAKVPLQQGFKILCCKKSQDSCNMATFQDKEYGMSVFCEMPPASRCGNFLPVLPDNDVVVFGVSRDEDGKRQLEKDKSAFKTKDLAVRKLLAVKDADGSAHSRRTLLPPWMGSTALPRISNYPRSAPKFWTQNDVEAYGADGTLRPALNRVFTNDFEVKAGKLIMFTDPPYEPGSETATSTSKSGVAPKLAGGSKRLRQADDKRLSDSSSDTSGDEGQQSDGNASPKSDDGAGGLTLPSDSGSESDSAAKAKPKQASPEEVERSMNYTDTEMSGDEGSGSERKRRPSAAMGKPPASPSRNSPKPEAPEGAPGTSTASAGSGRLPTKAEVEEPEVKEFAPLDVVRQRTPKVFTVGNSGIQPIAGEGVKFVSFGVDGGESPDTIAERKLLENQLRLQDICNRNIKRSMILVNNQEKAERIIINSAAAVLDRTAGVAETFVAQVTELSTNFLQKAQQLETRIRMGPTTRAKDALVSLQQSVTDLIEGSGALTEAYEADAENFYVDIHQSAEKVKKEVDETAREGVEAYFSDVLDNEVNAMSTDPELRALGSSIGIVSHQHMRSINGLRVEMSGEPLKTRVRPLLAQARASKFHLSLSERLGADSVRAATAFLQQKGQQAHPAFPGASHTARAPTESEEEREASKLEATVASVFSEFETEDKKKGATVRIVDDGEKGERRDRDGRRDRTDAKDRGDGKRRHEHRKDAHGSKHSLAQKETVKKDLTSLLKTPVKTKAAPSTPKRGTKLVWDSEEDGLDLADSAIANASRKLQSGTKRKRENSTPGSHKKRRQDGDSSSDSESDDASDDEPEDKKPALVTIAERRAIKWDSALLRTKEYLIEEKISIDNVPASNGNDYSSYITKRLAQDRVLLDIHGVGYIDKKIASWEKDPKTNKKVLRHARAAKTAFGLITFSGNIAPTRMVRAFCMIGDNGKRMPLSSTDTDLIKKNMIGLYRLLDPASISRVTAKKFKENRPGVPVKHTSDGFCPFCAYVVQNHCSLNNHIRRHLRLALFCNLGDCFYVTTDATKMWDHGKAKHDDIVHMGQAAAHFRGPR